MTDHNHSHEHGATCSHGHDHSHDHGFLGLGHHDHDTGPVVEARYRKVLWVVLAANAAMFLVEIGAGLKGLSMALLADALDFAGDAGNIAISLLVLSAVQSVRARASLFKVACMVAFSLWVGGATVLQLINGTVPRPEIMGVVSVLAIAVNLGSAAFLYRYRSGDSNVMSVWLCARNDAIGNVLVMIAAVIVWQTGSNLADAVVALLMVALGLSAAWRIGRQAMGELRGA
ncbi:cation transporter [Asticcacaulis machinosus]|uniref:Cation transporter n=1 Tax=Asticcacaulis machinosus TaxID=2984211 RepID=A0ABT5HPX1_9CAUL|nr:cation transporter [Asticcacaulis machinosus]MDC7677694.1 cation transporter [Asticcacaulis machinosus]